MKYKDELYKTFVLLKKTLNMRFSMLFLLIFVAGNVLFAQSPQKINYQMVLVDSTNSLVTSSMVGVRVSITDDLATNPPIYTELHNVMALSNGVVSIDIGDGTPILGVFSDIDWSNVSSLHVIFECDPNGGTNYSIIDTGQVLSVPYVFHATTAIKAPNANGGFIHYIGELYGGGIIIDLWKENGVEHGLIASLSDLSTGARWSSNFNMELGLFKFILSSGEAYTDSIVSAGDISGAAYLCHNYSGGGFTDWYLPSLIELEQLRKAVPIIERVLGANGSLSGLRYWSCVENDTFSSPEAFTLHMSIDMMSQPDIRDKDELNHVRAVRRF